MFKLLVVDDEWVIREGLQHTIPWHDWDIHLVQTAKSGEEALTILKEQSIDILLTDIRMPGLNGLDLIKEIKRQTSNLKIIILTGHNEFSYAQQAIRLQTDDYLLKPTDVKELEKVMKKTIQEILDKRTIEQELLSLQINQSLINTSSKNKKDDVYKLDWFQPGYRVLKIIFSEGTDIKFNFNQAVIIEHTTEYILLVYYKIQSEIVWHEHVKEAILLIKKHGIGAHLYTGPTADSLQQLKEAFNQSNAASNIVYEGEGITLYEYRNNQMSLKIEEVVHYIKQNYKQTIYQSDIAEELYMSNSHFSKLFKQQMGMGFSDYLTNVRIEAAKQLLASTKLKTYEIAEEVGYHEPRYFSQTFKKRIGMTPIEFREQGKG